MHAARAAENPGPRSILCEVVVGLGSGVFPFLVV